MPALHSLMQGASKPDAQVATSLLHAGAYSSHDACSATKSNAASGSARASVMSERAGH